MPKIAQQGQAIHKRFSMFDYLYMAATFARGFGRTTKIIGGCILAIDILSSIYGYQRIILWGAARALQTATWFQVVAAFIGCIPVSINTLLLFYVCFRLGDHYTTRMANKTNAQIHGHMASVYHDKSYGKDIVLIVVDIIFQGLPVIGIISSVTTTAGAFIGIVQPDTTEKFWYDAVVGGLLGIMIFFGGIFLTISGHHPIDHAEREEQQKRNEILGRQPIGGGNTTRVQQMSQPPVRPGLPSPTARLAQPQPIQVTQVQSKQVAPSAIVKPMDDEEDEEFTFSDTIQPEKVYAVHPKTQPQPQPQPQPRTKQMPSPMEDLQPNTPAR